MDLVFSAGIFEREIGLLLIKDIVRFHGQFVTIPNTTDTFGEGNVTSLDA